MHLSRKVWLGLAFAAGAYVFWRASLWRKYATSGVETPWLESIRLALVNPFTDPADPVDRGTSGITTSSAGQGGPTIVSIARDISDAEKRRLAGF